MDPRRQGVGPGVAGLVVGAHLQAVQAGPHEGQCRSRHPGCQPGLRQVEGADGDIDLCTFNARPGIARARGPDETFPLLKSAAAQAEVTERPQPAGLLEGVGTRVGEERLGAVVVTDLDGGLGPHPA